MRQSIENIFLENPVEFFSEQDTKECIDQIAIDPKNYQNILTQSMGKKNKQLPTLIGKFKEDSQFQKKLLQDNKKIIHGFTNTPIKLGTSVNFLYHMKTHKNEWIFKQISNEILEDERQTIREAISKSIANPNTFFQKLGDYFLDLLNRKLNPAQFVALINQESFKNKNISKQFKDTLKKMSCQDFISIFSTLAHNKQNFGILLHKVNFPIPLYLKSIHQNGPVQFFQPQLLEQILRLKNYYVVVNFGINDVQGKTRFINHLYSLNPNKNYLNRNDSEFHDESIKVYSSVPITHQNKHLIIIDFSGDPYQQSKQIKSVLKLFLNYAMTVFCHVNSQNFRSFEFKQKLSQYIIQDLQKIPGKAFLINRDSESNLIQKFQSIQLVNFPVIKEHLSVEVKAKNTQIIQKIQNLKFAGEHINSSKIIGSQRKQIIVQNEDKINNIIRILQNHKDLETLYISMFPKLYNEIQILKIKKALIDYQNQSDRKTENKNIYSEILNLRKKIEYLEKKQINKSQLILVSSLEFNKNFGLLDNFQDSLALWRNTRTEVIETEIIAKEAQFAGFKEQQIKEKKNLRREIVLLQKKMESFDISVDTIFSEIIAFNNRSFGQRKFNQEDVIIDKYYKRLLENVKPVNLIDGKTLSFGNWYLKSLLETLSQIKYSKSQIYVVSVIGAQSSAKSTLMNYLFKCGFATSAGRCTKGVYFTIVECDGKVIVVIDTEGLLSVSARDNTFNVQIASFVMLISDLVIINNKGEVNTTLRELIGVCIYAIHELNPTRHGEVYKPNEVMFTIRDQIDDGSNTQRMMLADIIKHLQQGSIVQYDKYMHFTDTDIFPMQSAFMTQNSGQITTNEANNCFGKAILALRSKIMEKLTNPKHKSLHQFYNDAESFWKAILRCGKDIFNFKCMLQIQKKTEMEKVLDNMKEIHEKKFTEKQEKIIKTYQKSMVQKEKFIIKQLESQFEIQKQVLKSNFKLRFPNIKQIDWVESFYPDIQMFNKKIHTICVSSVMNEIQYKRQNQQNEWFKCQIDKQLKEIYINDDSPNQIIKKISQMSRRWIQPTKKRIEELKQQKINENSETQSQIKKLCSRQIKGIFKQNCQPGFQIDCLEQSYQNIIHWHNRSMSKNQEDKTLSNRRIVEAFGKYINFGLGSDESLSKQINSFIKFCKVAIKQSLNVSSITTLDKIKPLIKTIVRKIDVLFQDLAKKIFQGGILLIKARYVLKAKSEICCIFASGLPKQIKNVIIDNKIREVLVEQRRRILTIQTRKQQINQSLIAKGNYQTTAQIWLNKIFEAIVNKNKFLSFMTVKKSLDTVNKNLNTEKLIRKAMNLSFDSSGKYTKDRIIKCYKVIANVNKFVREILHQEPQIKDLQQIVNKEVKFIIQNTKKDIQSQANMIKHDSKAHMPRHNIDYYSTRYNIDLSFYSQRDFGRFLDKILIIMSKKVEKNLTKYVSKSREIIRDIAYPQFVNQVSDYLQKQIEPSIIGCQHRCPGCGMKCKKAQGHTDGHQLLPNTHIEMCFNGFRNHQTKVRTASLCYTHEQVQKGHIHHNDQRLKFMEWIKKYHQQWISHFSKGPYQGIQRKAQCEFIWQNIGQMLIKHSFKDDSIVNDHKNGQYALNDTDMKTYNLIDY